MNWQLVAVDDLSIPFWEEVISNIRLRANVCYHLPISLVPAEFQR
jgi:hypothetical protein